MKIFKKFEDFKTNKEKTFLDLEDEKEEEIQREIPYESEDKNRQSDKNVVQRDTIYIEDWNKY